MKIAFVIYDLQKGGAERVVSLMSNELLSRKHEVDIVLLNNSIAYQVLAKIVVINAPAKNNFAAKAFNLLFRVFSLFILFRRKKYDKIFAFMPEAYVPSILTGYPVIASERNNPRFKPNVLRKFVLQRAKFVVSVSNGVAEVLKTEFAVKRVKTIYSPVLTQERRELDGAHPISGRYILAVGRLSKQKNFSLLIEAFSMSDASNDLKLVIAGEGSERSHLEQLINKLELKDEVILLGQFDEVELLYQTCEFLVLSSLFEGVPNVLLEALSHSKTAIATDCPYGPSEIIKHDYNGLLVKNNNIDELALAISELTENTELRQRLELNAKKSIEKYNIVNTVDEWLSI